VPYESEESGRRVDRNDSADGMRRVHGSTGAQHPDGRSRASGTAIQHYGAMNNPKNPNEVYVGIIDYDQINAANAGGGFLSTHPATDDRIKALKRMA
jgi:Zn-dependent protease with chaperone function